MSNHQGDRLSKMLRKLEHHRSMVERLLSDPEPVGADSAEEFALVCRKKIDVLEEVILELPRSASPELMEKWRERTIKLWKRYFTVIGDKRREEKKSLKTTMAEAAKVKKTKRSLSSNIGDGGDGGGGGLYLSSMSSLNSVHSIPEDDGVGHDDEPLTPSQTTSNSDSSPPIADDSDSRSNSFENRARNRACNRNRDTRYSVSSTNQHRDDTTPADAEQQKVQIREQLEAQFFQMNVVDNSSDVESIKRLLLVVAKAAQSLNQHAWLDESFQEDMLDLALPLLPEDKLEAFLDQCDRGQRRRRLAELKVFLSELIGAHYSSLNRSVIEQRMRIAWWASTGEQFCRYCRTFGHPIEDCPEVNGQVCFKCFGHGHKAKYCKIRPKHGGGVDTRKCYRCGISGHIARDCDSVMD